MHGDPGRRPTVNIVHNNNNTLYPPQNLAGIRNNMLPPPPRNMHAGNPPVGTVYIPREDNNMSQLSMFRNFQLHTRHNQNSYFWERNEDDQYPPGLSEIVMYGDDHTLSESTRPDGRYGGDEYLYENWICSMRFWLATDWIMLLFEFGMKYYYFCLQ